STRGHGGTGAPLVADNGTPAPVDGPTYVNSPPRYSVLPERASAVTGPFVTHSVVSTTWADAIAGSARAATSAAMAKRGMRERVRTADLGGTRGERGRPGRARPRPPGSPVIGRSGRWIERRGREMGAPRRTLAASFARLRDPRRDRPDAQVPDRHVGRQPAYERHRARHVLVVEIAVARRCPGLVTGPRRVHAVRVEQTHAHPVRPQLERGRL